MSTSVATRPAPAATLTAGRLPRWTTGVLLTVCLLASLSFFAAFGTLGLIRILLVTSVVARRSLALREPSTTAERATDTTM